MKLSELKNYRLAQRRALLKNRLLLIFLALALSALWYWGGQGLSPQERRLMDSVRTAQAHLYDWRVKGGSEFEPADDPHRTGFIGLEWSPLSTTLGALPAKRSACPLSRPQFPSPSVSPGTRRHITPPFWASASPSVETDGPVTLWLFAEEGCLTQRLGGQTLQPMTPTLALCLSLILGMFLSLSVLLFPHL